MPEFEAIIADEIYSFIGKKRQRVYIYTAIGITDMRYCVRFAAVFYGCNSGSLMRFLDMPPRATHYFTDGAQMYGAVLGRKVQQGKGPITNLIESFNSQIRQYVSALRRKTKAYAKTKEGLEQQLAHIVAAYDWLTPVRMDWLEKLYAAI